MKSILNAALWPSTSALILLTVPFLGSCSDELAPFVEKFSVAPQCGVLLDRGAGPVFTIEGFARGTGGNPIDGGSGNGGLDISWDLGDGAVADGSLVTHSYRSAGTYIVTVRVRDEDGDEDTRSAEVRVLDRAEAMTLTSGVASGPSAVTNGYRVDFIAAAQWACPTTRPLEVQFRYDWEFGDGGSRLDQSNPFHTYPVGPASYTARVTARELGTNVAVIQEFQVDIPGP